MSVSLIYAQAGASANSAAALFSTFGPLVLIFVVFYFLLIRPQQRRMKEHASKIAAAKRGDSVVTGGGLIGKVTRVEDDHVEIEIAQGVKVRAVKSTLADVLSPVGKAAND
jgi:preprotein translocase subunit YajC